MTDPALLAGWHGKLPSLGDFASRRLPPDFIEAWDGWLAGGLLALRENQPDDWLQAYLASPSWRFLLMPGVLPGELGEQAWAGVLMPSVDRVGRYFPLSLVQPLGPGVATTQEMQGLWHWLSRLDDLARDALFGDWSAEKLEQELTHLGRPETDLLPVALESAAATHGAALADLSPGEITELHPGLDAAIWIGQRAQQGWARASQGQAWWYAQPDDMPARSLVSLGLPAALQSLLGSATPSDESP